MAANAKDYQTRDRNRRIYRLAVTGWTATAIAREFGLQRTTVVKLLARTDKILLREMLPTVAQAKARQVTKLDSLLQEALIGYRRSQEDAVTITEKQTDDGTERSKQVRGQAGDARFLEVVRKVLADQRAIWGLDAPKKLEHSGKVEHNVTFKDRLAAVNRGLTDLLGDRNLN